MGILVRRSGSDDAAARRISLAAVRDLGRDEQFDPSFLATLASAAAPITIGPGEKKTQDLVIR
jgi:hypothetical protein